MGYYSEVALQISDEGFEKLWEHLRALDHPEKNDYRYTEFLSTSRVGMDGGYKFLHWFDIKWYWDVPNEVERFLKASDFEFKLIRIGEELDDLEVYSTLVEDDYYIEPRVSIDLNYDKSTYAEFVNGSWKGAEFL